MSMSPEEAMLLAALARSMARGNAILRENKKPLLTIHDVQAMLADIREVSDMSELKRGNNDDGNV